MRICLLDVNVLIALHDPSHVDSTKSHAWFNSEGQGAWATCPLTENGFVRIFTQTQYPNRLKGVSVALSLLGDTTERYGATHHFWPDAISLRDNTLIDSTAILGPKQITDVYLLALCQHYGGTFVTLDTKVSTAAIVGPHPDLLRVL